MKEKDGVRRRGRFAHRGLLGLAGLIAVAAAVVISLAIVRDAPTEGFQLRAQTMVPSEVYLPDDAACPSEPADSPFVYDTESALADELRVYDGELIAVRVTLSPNLGPVPEQVDFTASWPTSSVESASPVCAFVLTDEAVTPRLEWSRTGPATAEFSIREMRRSGPTFVEVWLKAVEPEPRTTFSTNLSTSATGDQVVVEPLGGRIAVQQRRGVAADIALMDGSADIVRDVIDVVAVITNPTPRDRAFDVELDVSSQIGGLTWSVPETPSGVTCSSGVQVSCSVGLVAASEVIEIPLSATLAGEFPLGAQLCGSEVRSSGICVFARARSETGNIPTTNTTTRFIALQPAAAGDFAITTDPAAVSRRPGEPADVRFLVSAVGGNELASVGVVGSDCADIAQADTSTDDGDAFLEVGEVWGYDCVLDSTTAGEFRLDLAGTSTTGVQLTGTYTGIVQIVDPGVAFSITDSDDLESTEVIATNAGRGAVYDVAVYLPGCTSQSVDQEMPILEQGQSIVVVCNEGVVEEGGVVAYGTDVSGRGFISRMADEEGE